jgi:hypothetical protein
MCKPHYVINSSTAVAVAVVVTYNKPNNSNVAPLVSVNDTEILATVYVIEFPS